MRTKEELLAEISGFDKLFKQSNDKHQVVTDFETWMKFYSDDLKHHKVEAAIQLYAMREALEAGDNIMRLFAIIRTVLSIIIMIILVLYLPLWPLIIYMILWLLKQFVSHSKVTVDERS